MDNRIEIKGRPEVQVLVDNFYERVNQDPMLGQIFNIQAQVNWPKHLPNMYDFWETLLFGRAVYKGFPFPKHTTLNLRVEHFDQWLALFNQTVDADFVGAVADEAKSKALNIATVFQIRLGLKHATINVAAK